MSTKKAPSEVYLIIEVADSSLKFDCETKAKAYAQAQINDYWVLGVVERQLYVFREPTSSGYKSKVVLGEQESISQLQFPDFKIDVREILPPTII